MVLTLNQSVPEYQCLDPKIELFVKNERAKSRLRDDLIPFNRLVGRPIISRDFISKIVEQFAEEISKKSHYFLASSWLDLCKPFEIMMGNILLLKPTRVSVQATNAPSVYIIAQVDGQNLHVDLNFNEETGKFEEAVVNIYSHKIQKFSDYGSIEELSLEIEKYFQPQQALKYENYIRSSYAIPGQTYSPYAF